MWRFADDSTPSVLTARENIASGHGMEKGISLPETAMLFFMSGGNEYLLKNYDCELLSERFPRFLNRCPIYRFKNMPLCFLDGGRGAPQAVDTLETLAALGVRRILSVGMFGAFDDSIAIGDIAAPDRAYVEEGTSLHYYPAIEYALPDEAMHKALLAAMPAKEAAIVTTDAVYRQTFYKERLWREKGAVGVDMETSALLSVSRYLGVQAAAVLMASDKHPLAEGAPKWQWSMTKEMRYALFEHVMKAIMA